MANTILQKTAVPFDASGVAEDALPTLAALVSCVGGELHFVTVLDDFVKNQLEGFASAEGATIQEVAKEALELISSKARDLGVDSSCQVANGDAASAIIKAAHEAGCTALAVPTHGFTGLAKFFMGNVAEKLVRDAGMPVLLIPPVA